MVFSDAGRIVDHGRLFCIADILLDDLTYGSTFQVLSSSSHKSKFPVHSTGAAQILAAGEAVDEGKVLRDGVQILMDTTVALWISVDSKGLYTSLSTQRTSIDKSSCADLNIIRFDFETESISRMFWIPGRCNRSDPGTKQDSPLQDTLNLGLYTGRIFIYFPNMESGSSNAPLA